MHTLIRWIISLLLPTLTWGQIEYKYIIVDSLTQKFNFNKYTINAMPYGYHQGIDIYNVWISSDEFLLLSVFPETESGNKWEKISLEAFHSKALSTQQLLREVDNPKNNYKLFYPYYMIKKEGNSFYRSKTYCSIEKFRVVNFPSIFHISGANIINLGQQFTSYNELKTAYLKLFPDRDFPLEATDMRYAIPRELESIYLSHIEEKKGNKIYFFWSFTDNAGVSRFAFIKNKGIVGGSYDDYFIPRDKYIGKQPLNILSKKEIMWAEELKKEWAEKEKSKK